MNEKEMTLDEKHKYLAEYPLKTEYYDGDDLVDTDEDELDEALGGVGYSLVTGAEMIEATGSKVDEDGSEIVKNGFYTVDICDEKSSVGAYSYQGKEIKEVIENIISWDILDLDYSEDGKCEEIEVDGEVVEYDEVRRSSNLEKYEMDFKSSNEINRLGELLSKRELEIERYELKSKIEDKRQEIGNAKRDYTFSKTHLDGVVILDRIKTLEKELEKYEERRKELDKLEF